MNGLRFFTRTNDRRLWDIACWHSPHSLTWRWILSLRLGRPTWRPHLTRNSAVFSIGLGSAFSFWISGDNNGIAWSASVLGASLLWQTQAPMWWRDIYRRERDERDGFGPRIYPPQSATHVPPGSLQ
jgi:hypothetical protein